MDFFFGVYRFVEEGVVDVFYGVHTRMVCMELLGVPRSGNYDFRVVEACMGDFVVERVFPLEALDRLIF